MNIVKRILIKEEDGLFQIYITYRNAENVKYCEPELRDELAAELPCYASIRRLAEVWERALGKAVLIDLVKLNATLPIKEVV